MVTHVVNYLLLLNIKLFSNTKQNTKFRIVLANFLASIKANCVQNRVVWRY